jgi:deoxyribodipyrimidine photo-lyase
VHEVFREIANREKWNPNKLAPRAKGSREGWWNMSANTENFLDQLITWREPGYNFSAQSRAYDRYGVASGLDAKDLEAARKKRTRAYLLSG